MLTCMGCLVYLSILAMVNVLLVKSSSVLIPAGGEMARTRESALRHRRCVQKRTVTLIEKNDVGSR